jgi:hypothetical protein
LLVETADGRAIAANAGGLARFLAQQRGLQLIFLNACATEGQVMDLLDVGVPAVIATDQAVEDATATAFAARFYKGLVGSPPIVLFYGQSGVGKSSLLAAGLLPRLEASHSVRYTRRDQARGLPGTLAAALKSSPGDDLSAVWRTSDAEASRMFLAKWVTIHG